MRSVNRKRFIQGFAILILGNVAGYIIHSGDIFHYQNIISWIMMAIAGWIIGSISLEKDNEKRI